MWRFAAAARRASSRPTRCASDTPSIGTMEFDAAIALLRSERGNALKVRSALERLRILTNPAGMEDDAMRAGVPAAIIDALRLHPREPGVQEAGSGVLTNLLTSDDDGALERARAIAAAGALETVSAAVAAALAFANGDVSKYVVTERSLVHPEVSMVILEGCAFLAASARQGPELRQAALTAGAAPAWLLDEAPVEVAGSAAHVTGSARSARRSAKQDERGRLCTVS